MRQASARDGQRPKQHTKGQQGPTGVPIMLQAGGRGQGFMLKLVKSGQGVGWGRRVGQGAGGWGSDQRRTGQDRGR